MKNLWNDADAEQLVKHYAESNVGRDLALRVYTTRLLGGDPRDRRLQVDLAHTRPTGKVAHCMSHGRPGHGGYPERDRHRRTTTGQTGLPP